MTRGRSSSPRRTSWPSSRPTPSSSRSSTPTSPPTAARTSSWSTAPGPSLAERYKRERFAVEDALRTGIRLAGAVATAHAAGILHRDIKPANVLTNDYGWPALTDFGISSNLEGELPVHTVTSPADASATSSGQSAIGMSVPWSPAEMFEDDPRPDQRSDVFSLAATVHTLLAGRTPFEIPGRPNGALDLIGRIERGAITPIDRADVPRSLASVLAKGMAVRREDRYPSAVEFARALQRVELELGYAATTIEVPNLASERAATDDDEADATRARAVRSVEAQPRPAPTHDDATRARTPQQVDAQPGRPRRRRRPRRARWSGPPAGRRRRLRPRSRGDVGWAGRRDGGARDRPGRAASASAPVDATQVRPRSAAPDGPVAGCRVGRDPHGGRSRSRVGRVVGIAAGLVVVAAIGIAVALSGTLQQGAADPTAAPSDQDAILAATVPAPERRRGRAVARRRPASHSPCRMPTPRRATATAGSGPTARARPRCPTAPTIVVAGVAASERVCIDVQVQRGSKTSETVTGCTP